MLKQKNIILSLFLFLLITSFMIANPFYVNASEQYDNTEIRVLVWRDAHSKAVKDKVSEFEKETGIDVIIDDLPTQSLTQKMAMNLTSKTGKYDIVAVDEPYVPKFASYFINYNDWPQPKAMENKVDLSIVPQGAVDAGSWQNEVKGLPINANVYMFTYRKDLINDKDLKRKFKNEYDYELQTPENLNQLYEIGKFLSDEKDQFYGWAPFTVKSEGATVEFMWLLRSFGTKILNDDLEVVLNVDKAVKAIDYYKKLLEISPPSKLSMGHPETIQNMESGKLFSTLQWPAIIAGHENPENSVVAGKLAYSTNPAGPGGASAITGVWTLAIPKSSDNKQAAAEFAYWWGSKKSGRELVEAGMSPMRKDLLKDPELQKKYPWYQALMNNLSEKNAVHRPRFPQYPKVSDEISTYFSRVISGSMEAETAMIELKENINNIVEEYKNE